jgi:hypothetical protein
MVPRIDLCRVLARPAVEPDFPNMLCMAVGTGCKSGVDGYGKEGGGRASGQRRFDKAVVTLEPSAYHQPTVESSTPSRGFPLSMHFAWVTLEGNKNLW